MNILFDYRYLEIILIWVYQGKCKVSQIRFRISYRLTNSSYGSRLCENASLDMISFSLKVHASDRSFIVHFQVSAQRKT